MPVRPMSETVSCFLSQEGNGFDKTSSALFAALYIFHRRETKIKICRFFLPFDRKQYFESKINPPQFA